MVKRNPLARVGKELAAEVRRRRNVPRVDTPKADREQKPPARPAPPLEDPIATLGHPARPRRKSKR